VFRRRRSEDADRDEFDYDEPEQPAGVPHAEGGPWDAEEPFPALERVDLGSLQVPIGPEHEIQLVMAEQHGAWVTIRYRESEVQIQAFAAARRGAGISSISAFPRISPAPRSSCRRYSAVPRFFSTATASSMSTTAGSAHASGERRGVFDQERV